MAEETARDPKAGGPALDPPNPRLPGWLPWLAGILLLAGVGALFWLSFPLLDQLIIGKYTPTPLPPSLTPTPTLTRTPTVTPTITITPTPTSTPYPPSAFAVDAGSLDPPLRGAEGTVIVLNEDTSAAADPDFTHPMWIPSSQIARQLGLEIREPYFATFAPGAITWKMDVPLPPGLYEIYVMDTLYSSGGRLEFSVALGDQALTPLIGSRSVDFQSTRSEIPQTADQWRTIGIYQLDRPDLLTISSRWEKRDENSIVAVDRVLIRPLPPSSAVLLSPLPKNYSVWLVDDLQAEIKTSQVLFPERAGLSWGDQYQYLVNPAGDVTITYAIPDLVLPGKYQIAAWVPAAHASGSLTYRLLVNDAEVALGDVAAPLVLDQARYPGGQWVVLGIWNTPPIYEKPVRLVLQMQVKGGTSGEIAFDVVAFLRVP